MCIRTIHDVTYSVIDMEDSISKAAEKADRLESYLNTEFENPSFERILYDLNSMESDLKSALSTNAYLRKEINRVWTHR